MFRHLPTFEWQASQDSGHPLQTPEPQHPSPLKVYVPGPSEFDMGPYSYDETHLAPFRIPSDVLKYVPPELRVALQHWACAGAAVCTSLERIGALEQERLYRGYPEGGPTALSAGQRSLANTYPAALGSEGVADFIAAQPSPPASRTSSCADLPLLAEHESALALSPSISMRAWTGWSGLPPVDSEVWSRAYPAPPTPADSRRHSVATSPTDRPKAPAWSEPAWSTYQAAYREELFDLHQVATPRLLGAERVADKLLRHEARRSVPGPAMQRIAAWWARQKPVTARVLERARPMRAPILEQVLEERRAHGLAV